MGLPALKEAEALMAAAREGAGDDMDIMVDLHGRTSAAMAIQYAKVLEPYRPFFIEEPCQPEDWQGTAPCCQVHAHSDLLLVNVWCIAMNSFRCCKQVLLPWPSLMCAMQVA